MNTVTISLEEYEKLKHENNVLSDAIYKRKSVHTWYYGYSQRFYIVEDNDIENIIHSINRISDENADLKKEIFRLSNKPNFFQRVNSFLIKILNWGHG